MIQKLKRNDEVLELNLIRPTGVVTKLVTKLRSS